MNLLSQIRNRINLHQSAKQETSYNLYRNCSLAVLNAGSHTDNAEEIFQKYQGLSKSDVHSPRTRH